jgi:hypothetical protein
MRKSFTPMINSRLAHGVLLVLDQILFTQISESANLNLAGWQNRNYGPFIFALCPISLLR